MDYTDAQLQDAIDAASSAIERYCGRTFAATDYKLWITPDGGAEIRLPEYPLIALRQVSLYAHATMYLSNSAVGAVWYSCSVANGKMQLTVVGGAMAGTSELTLSTYTSLALLLAAIVALGKGWTGSVVEEADPSQIRPGQSSSNTTSGVLYVYTPALACECDILSASAGIIAILSGWPHGLSVFVNYRAGYEIIPAQLTDIANRLTMDILTVGTGGGSYASEQVGNVSYTYLGIAERMINAYTAELAMWKRAQLWP